MLQVVWYVFCGLHCKYYSLYYRFFICITDFLSVLQIFLSVLQIFYLYYRFFICITDVVFCIADVVFSVLQMFFSVLQRFFLEYRCFFCITDVFLYYRYVACTTYLAEVCVCCFSLVCCFFLHLAHSWKHWGCEEGPAEGLSNASGFAEGPGHWETAFGPAQGPSPMWKVNLALQKGQMQYIGVCLAIML